MSFFSRAMSRPISLATASARAPSAWPRPPSSLVWNSRYFLRRLHAHGDRHARGLHRARAEHREFLEHDLELGIGLQQREHVAHGVLAVAAIVVEELDEGDVALRIAEHDLVGRVEQQLGVRLDGGLVLFGLGGLLALLQLAPSPPAALRGA